MQEVRDNKIVIKTLCSLRFLCVKEKNSNKIA